MEVVLSLIVPVYNAEIFILDTLTRITEWKKEFPHNTQIIIVDDGSKDKTKAVIEQYINGKDNSIELLEYGQNKGKGYAVRAGMLAAKGKYRIFTDADIPFGFPAIERIFYYLDFKEFDVCIGNRKSENSQYLLQRGFMRKLSSQIFTFIISRYVVTGVNDTQCGLKGFRAHAADFLFSRSQIDGFAFDVEILYICYKYEFDFKRLPVEFEGNNISTIRLGKSSIEMFWAIMCLPFRYHFSGKYKGSSPKI